MLSNSLAASMTPRKELLITQVGPPLWAMTTFFFMAENVKRGVIETTILLSYNFEGFRESPRER